MYCHIHNTHSHTHNIHSYTQHTLSQYALTHNIHSHTHSIHSYIQHTLLHTTHAPIHYTLTHKLNVHSHSQHALTYNIHFDTTFSHTHSFTYIHTSHATCCRTHNIPSHRTCTLIQHSCKNTDTNSHTIYTFTQNTHIKKILIHSYNTHSHPHTHNCLMCTRAHTHTGISPV